MKQTNYGIVSTSIILLVLVWFASVNLMGMAAKLSDKYVILRFSVHGATCASCMVEIDKALRAVNGIKAVSLDPRQRPLRVSVVADKLKVQAKTIESVLAVRKYQVTDLKTLPYSKEAVTQMLLPNAKKVLKDKKPTLLLPQ